MSGSIPPDVFLGKGILKISHKFTPMPKCDFNKIALQLYRNHTSAWVFSCMFAAYFHMEGCFCIFHKFETLILSLFVIIFHFLFIG